VDDAPGTPDALRGTRGGGPGAHGHARRRGTRTGGGGAGARGFGARGCGGGGCAADGDGTDGRRNSAGLGLWGWVCPVRRGSLQSVPERSAATAAGNGSGPWPWPSSAPHAAADASTRASAPASAPARTERGPLAGFPAAAAL